MRLPRSLLLPACAGLTALAYYLILFTNWGNLYHPAPYHRKVATQAVVVLAVFSCAEVMRTEKVVPLRAIAGAVGTPLLLVTLLFLWHGLRRWVVA